jgi:hypothetical protein
MTEKKTGSILIMLFAGAALAPALAYAQHQHAAAAPADAAKPAAKKPGDSKKMADAMSAAPASIAKQATLMDWPEKEGGEPRQLRAGTNEWVCFPSSPSQFGAASVGDPMCLDKQWQSWGNGWMSKTPPKVTGTGVAYMLKGDKGASNTDPFATGPTPTNEWVVSPPHIMVVYQDLKMLDAFPTDPKSGGPWVMWKGTPYAHLMVPVSPTQTAMMK